MVSFISFISFEAFSVQHSCPHAAVFFFFFFFLLLNIKCAKLKTLFLQHSAVLAGERSLLSFPAARQFLISHNVRMSPSSIQFQLQFRFFFFFFFYLHLKSSSVDVVFFFFFFLTLIIESEQWRERERERLEFRLEREQSEHPSAGVDKKAECSGSVQGQSERWEESVDLLMEQRWQSIYSSLPTTTRLLWPLFFFLTLSTPAICSLPSFPNFAPPPPSLSMHR